jgi:tetratricopeptide (TPR) repeat protein
MTRAAPSPSTPALSTNERRRVQHNLDRIEDRLRDAPEGLHAVNPPADPVALAASPLPPAARLLWAQWDGLELAAGELRLWPLAELAQADAALRGEDRLRADDIPIGERGNDILVLCADPHAEGADVVLVEEDGERLPHSAGVDLLVLAVLGEIAVLYDEEGEFQEHLFKADGQLSRAAERRLLRRHLDLDPDAPLARFRLARSLRRAGELRAAASELRQLLRRAPDFAWGQHERGRVSLALGEPADAGQAFVQASELAADPGLRAYFLAWACLAAATAPVPADSKPVRGRGKSPLDRNALAAQVLALSPEFVRAQEAAVRSALEAEDAAHAEESLHLGLAVVPGHLGLLSLRPAVTELVANAPADQEDEDENDDLDEADVEIKAARAAAAADDDLSDRDDPLEFPLGDDDEDYGDDGEVDDEDDDAPVAASKAPASRNKPAAASKAPVSRNKPAAASKAPVSRNKPAAASKAPASRNKPAAPKRNKAPASRGKAPAKRR